LQECNFLFLLTNFHWNCIRSYWKYHSSVVIWHGITQQKS
jgi:hypothetical protein